MGTFTFRWPHVAEEVYVTGTFDEWSKSEKLEKVGDVFEKTVTLPETSEKIYYKFVVDGLWVTDHAAPQEKDHEGNENNVLLPENIVKEKSEPETAVMNSSAAPESTTAQLAGAVPLEDKKDEPSAPGGFPETPAADLDKEFKVSPLPATENALNPIKLAPGEKIPEGIAAESIHNHVTLDKESYEKSDRLPGLEDLPPVTSNMIPESSLPIVGGHPASDVTISSAAPISTTAALAANVPFEEPKVPEVVRESQEAAHVEPGASGMSTEVKEKAAVEDELLEKVPEAPSTSEGTGGLGTEKSEDEKTLAETVGAAAAATTVDAASSAQQSAADTATSAAVTAQQTAATAAAAVTGAAITAKETATDAAINAAAQLPEPVKQALPTSVQETAATANKEKILEAVSPEVPIEVKESIAEAGTSPEAAADTAAVVKKEEVEAELLKEIKPIEDVSPEAVSSKVPTEVKDSIEEAGKSPEAAANTAAVVKKEEVEAELMEEVKPVEAIGVSSAKTDEAHKEEPKVEEPKLEPAVPLVPAVAAVPETNGAKAAAPAAAPATVETTTKPTSSTPPDSAATPSSTKAADSPSTAERKKKNRLSSFINKLKSKVSHKDKA